MDDKERAPRKRPEPKRLEALKNLPKELVQSLSREEVNAFLFDGVWPESLREKLTGYIVENK